MIAAHRQWNQVGALDKPVAWTRRVVINKAASLYQRRLAELRAIARLGPLRGSLPPPLDADFEHLWHEVRRLPRRQAQAVALFYIDDITVATVAEVMECTESSVWVHLPQGPPNADSTPPTPGRDRMSIETKLREGSQARRQATREADFTSVSPAQKTRVFIPWARVHLGGRTRGRGAISDSSAGPRSGKRTDGQSERCRAAARSGV